MSGCLLSSGLVFFFLMDSEIYLAYQNNSIQDILASKSEKKLYKIYGYISQLDHTKNYVYRPRLGLNLVKDNELPNQQKSLKYG